MRKSDLLKKLSHQFPEHIVEAFRAVPRESFMPEEYGTEAYADAPQPIGQWQTISQPSTIAFMLQLLELDAPLDAVLELGSGSGYVLALLSEICPDADIYGVELDADLVQSSKKNTKRYSHITIYHRNGKNGLAEHAPYDRILISASSDEPPFHLRDQLEADGVIVAPVQDSILKITQDTVIEYPGFRFVPFKK
ncbi:MAG: protein-L-isoaspartate O-methyltransferase family protein [Nanoarchaeota archaeon]